jgi:hypothetical protein
MISNVFFSFRFSILIDCHHLLLTVCHNFKDGNLVSISNRSGKEFVIEIPHQFQCIRGVPRYEIRASMATQPSTRDIDTVASSEVRTSAVSTGVRSLSVVVRERVCSLFKPVSASLHGANRGVDH